MKANADSLTEHRWFRALTDLGQAFHRPHCASPVEEAASEPKPPTRARKHSQLSIVRTDLFTGRFLRQIVWLSLRNLLLFIQGSMSVRGGVDQWSAILPFTPTDAPAASKLGAILIGSLLMGVTAKADAGVLELSGRLDTTAFGPSGQINWQASEFFQLVTDSKHYRIRICKAGQDLTRDYVEVAYDGTNTYYLNVMLGWIERQRAAGAAVGDNVATAVITDTPVPQFPYAEQASVLWCAYIAPTFLAMASQGDQMYTPFCTGIKSGSSSAEPSDFLRFPVMWTSHGLGQNNQAVDRRNTVQYLEQLSFLTSIPENNSAANSQNISARTNAFYRTTEWTDWEAEKLPSAGSATIFVTRDSPPWRNLEFSFRMESKASKPERVSFQPVVPGLTSVTEERFNDVGKKNLHFSYFISTNWLTLEEARRTPAFQQSFAAVSNQPKPIGGFATLVRVLFVGLLGVPFVWIWYNRRSKT